MEVYDFLTLRRMLRHVYLQELKPVLLQYGLTQIEEDILLFLANNPGHDTAAELVELRAMSKSQVSAAVDRLVQREYLERQPEGRRIHLHLLPASEPAVRMGQELQVKFGEDMLNDFTEEERVQLGKILVRLTEAARRIHGQGK